MGLNQTDYVETVVDEEIEEENGYVEEPDGGLDAQRRDRQMTIRRGLRDLMSRDGLPKPDVPMSEIKKFCKAIVDETKSTTHDDRALRREVRRLLAFDSNLLYYGCATDGTHHLFRVAESLDEEGKECSPGRVCLYVDGRISEHPWEHIPHDEMKSLTMRPFADRRLPAAVVYMIARRCEYLGYCTRTKCHYLWQPSRGPRDEPTRTLVLLRIDPQHPGVVRTQGQHANCKVVLGPGTTWIPRMHKEGRLQPTGPLFLDGPDKDGTE